MKKLIVIIYIGFSIYLPIIAFCQIDNQSYEETDYEPGTLSGYFNVSNEGAAVYSIPLDLPPGRNGMTPSLGLVYNSLQSGNILGKGWGLSGFSSISRTNPTIYYNGQPDNIDFENDQLVYDGQKLVILNLDEYRPENDPSTKIEYLMGEFGDYFKVYLSNGIIKEYGNTENSRQEFSYEGPDACPLIWHINKIIDPLGNTILFDYYKNLDYGELHPFKIVYTGFEQNGEIINEGFYSVQFDYQPLCPEYWQTYYCQKGIHEYINANSQRLSNIYIKYSGEYDPIKEFEFKYLEPTFWSNTNILDESFLKEILVKVPSGEEEKIIRGAAFDWSFYDPTYTTNYSAIDEDTTPHIYFSAKKMCRINISGSNKDDIAVCKKRLDGGEWEVVISVFYNGLCQEMVIPVSSDFNGSPVEPIAIDIDFNGDEELVFNENGMKIYDFIPDGAGNYSANLVYSDSHSGKIKAGDINGDGLIDIFLVNDVECLFYQGTGNPENPFLIQSMSLPFENVDQLETLADFNGDGKSDILWREYPDYHYKVFALNAENEFAELSDIFYAEHNQEIGRQAFYVDLNGDGKTDLCFINYTEHMKDCYFSFGDGFMGKITSQINGNEPNLVMDMNNDGLADYIQIFTSTATLKIAYGMPDGISMSTNIYSFSIEFNPNQIIEGIYDMVLADIDGNGIQDLVTEFYELVDLTVEDTLKDTENKDKEGNRPLQGRLLKLYSLQDEGPSGDLITSYKNGLGLMYNVSYSQSNQVPETYSNYPVTKSSNKFNIVHTSCMTDGVVELNRCTYHYSMPLLHKLGKGFLGYESIRVDNNQNNTFALTQNTIYSENGHFYFNYPALIQTYSIISSRQEVLINETVNSMHVRIFHETDPPVYRPIVTTCLNLSWDNNDGHSFIRTDATFISLSDIDNYGNLLKSISCSDQDLLSIHNFPEDYEFSKTRLVTYLVDEENWILNRTSTIETTLTSESDPNSDESFTELTYYEPGEAGSNGIISWPLLKQKLITPNHSNQMAIMETYDYDKYGNLHKSEINAPNASPALPAVTSIFEHNEELEGRFLTTKHEGTSNQPFITEYHYDEINGKLLYEINPQGLQTNFEYNPFGRLSEVIPPTNIKTQSLLAWSEGNEDAPEGALYYTKTNKLLNNPIPTESEIISRHYNKFGQELRTVRSGFNGNIIYTDKIYDNKGRPWKVSEPYFKGNHPDNWIEYQYDNLGRITTTVLPTHSITVEYNGRNSTITNQGTGIAITKTINALSKEVEKSDPAGIIQYDYFSSGLVKSIDVSGVRTDFTYDAAGHQFTLVDPDAGPMIYNHNAYGQLMWQRDAKGNTFVLNYDDLNRLMEKELVGQGTQARYTYNDVPGTPEYGMPQVVEGTEGIAYSYEYDGFGRLRSLTESLDGISAVTSYNYCSFSGKVASIIYPTGIEIHHNYDHMSGDLTSVWMDNERNILWQLNSMNARGQITNYTLGNGLDTYKNYDEFGFPTQISTYNFTDIAMEPQTNNPGDDLEDLIQNLRYQFDPITGNMSSRSSELVGSYLVENFQYDELLLSRLTEWQVTGCQAYSALYDDNGNIEAKTGITTDYRYHSEYMYGDNAGPHAVTRIAIPTEEYRNHSTPQSIVFTAFNKIKEITQVFPQPSSNPGDETWRLQVTYGPDENRIRTQLFQEDELVKTKYFFGGNYEEEHTRNYLRKLHYIYAGDGLFAIYVMNGGNDTMYYIHKDIQGSFDVITNESGNVLERLSFDPWGRRRNATDWTYENVPPPHYFDRGYTGHEHLDIFGLINMNGRVYDPWLGRFLSPDPFVQSPGNSQSYNRYSYCLNNPLKYVDPSGYFVNRHPADWSKSGGGGYMWGYNVSGMYFYDMARTNFSLYCNYVSSWGDIGNMDFQTWKEYGGEQGMSGSEVFNNYVAQNSIQFTGQAAHSLYQDVVDGMNLYSVSAFGRNTLVSCFGDLGPIEEASDGGIYFNNPTAGAYIGESVIFDEGTNTNQYANGISFGIGLESTLVSIATSEITEVAVKSIAKGANVVGSITGVIDNTIQSYVSFSNNNYIEGTLQGLQATAYAAGTVMLLTPLAPIGAGIILVNGLIDLGEYFYKNW